MIRSERRLRLRRPNVNPAYAWAVPYMQIPGEPRTFRLYESRGDGTIRSETVSGVEVRRAFDRIESIRAGFVKLGVF